ncbi:MAG: sugar ABC transporter permease, partial [Clostridia bacterium]|nr:sugar ABC transporter permease [Clostridia bacterium]
MSNIIKSSSNKRILKPKNSSGFISELSKNKDKYLLIAPFFILFTIFTIIPVVISIPISFTEFNMIRMPKFVGWENFARIFVDDDVFLIAVKNTIIFAFLTGPISYFACLFFAWLIN